MPSARQAVPGEILVAVTLAAPQSVEDEIAQRYGLQRLESWPIDLVARRIVRYRIAGTRSIPSVAAAMRGDQRILTSQPNFLYDHQGKAAQPSHASLQYALAKLDIPAAHALSRGQGTVIAVIDSGIDGTHPDLKMAVIQTFTTTAQDADLLLDPHGTEVAGIVAADGNLEGVAPDAQLLDVRVFGHDAGATALATSLSLLRGLDWAAAHHASVINMSLSGPEDALLHESIQALVQANHVVLAAAGNGGKDAPPSYPAAYDEVIAVTATDPANRLYDDANRGRYIDVAAPGVDVLCPTLNSSYTLASGTSFAAAHVSGVVALMLSRHPGMTAAQIRSALESGAADLGAPGVDTDFGHGLISALSVLR